PSARSTGPNGHRNRVSLPNQWMRRSSANMASTPTTKSQFDVCGATITTNFGARGTAPTILQRESHNPTRPIIWSDGRCRRGASKTDEVVFPERLRPRRLRVWPVLVGTLLAVLKGEDQDRE